MRSPRHPGLVQWWPTAPASFPGTPSGALNILGHAQRGSNYVLSDKHFSGIEGIALAVTQYDGVLVERCTFANIGRAMYFADCTDVTVRDCGILNLLGSNGAFVGPGHGIQSNGADGVLIEDCWILNLPGQSLPSDQVSFFATENGIVRRVRIMGGGTETTGSGIILGDGARAQGGGDNLLAEDNVVIDASIGAIGTNCIVRRNAVLYRGIEAVRDTQVNSGIILALPLYEGQPTGPVEISDNEMRCYKSTGQQSGLAVRDIVHTGLATNDVDALIDPRTRWTPTGYYGWSEAA